MRRGIVAGAAVVVLGGAFVVQRAAAGDGSVQVSDVRVPQPLNGATTASVYATIRNGTGTADRLLGVKADVGSGSSLMQETTTDGVGYMSDVPSIALPAHATVKLTPGVRHGMLQSVTQLPVGSRVTLTFEFATAEPIVVTTTVASR